MRQIILRLGICFFATAVSSVLFLLIPFSTCVLASDPDCTAVDAWPTSMAFVSLKNAGITDNSKIDFTKTKAARLVSEKIGDNLYRQIHLIKFTERTGKTIEVITVNDASYEECSMSGVDVYVISEHLGKRGARGGNGGQ